MLSRLIKTTEMLLKIQYQVTKYQELSFFDKKIIIITYEIPIAYIKLKKLTQ